MNFGEEPLNDQVHRRRVWFHVYLYHGGTDIGSPLLFVVWPGSGFENSPSGQQYYRYQNLSTGASGNIGSISHVAGRRGYRTHGSVLLSDTSLVQNMPFHVKGK